MQKSKMSNCKNSYPRFITNVDFDIPSVKFVHISGSVLSTNGESRRLAEKEKEVLENILVILLSELYMDLYI